MKTAITIVRDNVMENAGVLVLITVKTIVFLHARTPVWQTVVSTVLEIALLVAVIIVL